MRESGGRLYVKREVTAVFILISTLLFTACSNINSKDFNGKNSGKNKNLVIDSFVFAKPGIIEPREKKRLELASAAWYDTYIAPSNFNGGVLIAKNGQIIFEKYKGSNPLNSADSMTGNKPIHIASVTKTFTAMAILMLQEQGKLRLEDEVSKYFPQFNYPGITIFTLLTHRSGLPSYEYFLDNLKWDQNKTISNYEMMNFMISHKADIKDIRPPNRAFSYCNTNYALLALVIEKITGESYPDFLKDNIFDPAGMKNTFVYTPKDSLRITPDYDWKGTFIPMNYLDRIYGDKNIFSTVRDLFKWDRLLSDGLLLSPKSLNAAYTPYSNEKPGIKNYGLGWRMNIYPNGKKMIFHNGWWHGNTSSLIRLVDEDATVIALNNRFSRITYKTKMLVNVFGYYFDEAISSEEESGSENAADTLSENVKDSTKKK